MLTEQMDHTSLLFSSGRQTRSSLKRGLQQLNDVVDPSPATSTTQPTINDDEGEDEDDNASCAKGPSTRGLAVSKRASKRPRLIKKPAIKRPAPPAEQTGVSTALANLLFPEDEENEAEKTPKPKTLEQELFPTPSPPGRSAIDPLADLIGRVVEIAAPYISAIPDAPRVVTGLTDNGIQKIVMAAALDVEINKIREAGDVENARKGIDVIIGILKVYKRWLGVGHDQDVKRDIYTLRRL